MDIMLEKIHAKVLNFFDHFCGYLEQHKNVNANLIGFHVHVIGELLFLLSSLIIMVENIISGYVISTIIMLLCSVLNSALVMRLITNQEILLSSAYKYVARNSISEGIGKLLFSFLVILLLYINAGSNTFGGLVMSFGIVISTFGFYMLIANPQPPEKKTVLSFQS